MPKDGSRGLRLLHDAERHVALGEPHQRFLDMARRLILRHHHFEPVDGADVILVLDAKNPKISARLATAFRSWRTLEAGRRDRAEATLKRIMSAPKLSRDLSDIVERALAVS